MDAVPQYLARRFNDQNDRIPLLPAASNRAYAVDVTGHQMPAESFIECHCALEIDGSASRETSERRHRQRFRRHFDHEGPLVLPDHRQTSAIDADAVADLEIGQHR